MVFRVLLILIKMSSFQQKNETCKETGKDKQKEQSIETVSEEVQTLHLWDFIPFLTLSHMLLRESNLHNCTWQSWLAPRPHVYVLQNFSQLWRTPDTIVFFDYLLSLDIFHIRLTVVQIGMLLLFEHISIAKADDWEEELIQDGIIRFSC